MTFEKFIDKYFIFIFFGAILIFTLLPLFDLKKKDNK